MDPHRSLDTRHIARDLAHRHAQRSAPLRFDRARPRLRLRLRRSPRSSCATSLTVSRIDTRIASHRSALTAHALASASARVARHAHRAPLRSPSRASTYASPRYRLAPSLRPASTAHAPASAPARVARHAHRAPLRSPSHTSTHASSCSAPLRQHTPSPPPPPASIVTLIVHLSTHASTRIVLLRSALLDTTARPRVVSPPLRRIGASPRSSWGSRLAGPQALHLRAGIAPSGRCRAFGQTPPSRPWWIPHIARAPAAGWATTRLCNRIGSTLDPIGRHRPKRKTTTRQDYHSTANDDATTLCEGPVPGVGIRRALPRSTIDEHDPQDAKTDHSAVGNGLGT